MSMWKRGYYCFIAGLPELLFDEGKITSALLEFREELQAELHPKDYTLVHALFLPVDHQNLTRFLTEGHEELDPLGNYTIDQIRAQIQNIDAIIPQPDILEKYLVGFLTHWYAEDTDKAALNSEHILTTGYYDLMESVPNCFLKDWFEFDRNLRNIMTAVNCRKHNREILPEMIGSGVVVQHLVKNTARDFGLTPEIDDMEKILQVSELPDLLDREERLDLLRWDFIENKTFFHYFDIEKILGYILKLMIALRWSRLDRRTGENLFREMLQKMEKSYEFPEEFEQKK